ASALIAVLSVGAGVWLLPLLAGITVAFRSRVRTIAAACVAALALSLPSLLELGFLDSAAASTVQQNSRLANLIQPLSPLQLLGIWPVGDCRLRPDTLAQTYVLVAVVALAAAGGLVVASRAAPPLVIYAGAALAGCAAVLILGSAWVGAKALATASP